MTYLDLIREADWELDKGKITLGEYEDKIEPLRKEIKPSAEKPATIYRKKAKRWKKKYMKLKSEIAKTSPCDLCKYNPPSAGDNKPCTMCPAERRTNND